MAWLIVPVALGAGWLWAWLDHNSSKVRSHIDGLPKPKRRAARVLFLVVVLAVGGFATWVDWAADNARQEVQERASLTGGVPVFPGQP